MRFSSLSLAVVAVGALLCCARAQPAHVARAGWTGSEWPQLTLESGQAWAYDPGRARVVLFGGWIGGRLSNETWEWDGSTWDRVPVATAPNARVGHELAFDPVRKTVLLFGGRDHSTGPPLVYDDLWEWDGRSWAKLSARGPVARYGCGLVTDVKRGRVVLFGGYRAGGTPLADTWEWDGRSWLAASPKQSPAARGTRFMAYEPVRQRVVAIGGFDGKRDLPLDVWEWDGRIWQRVAASGGGPTPRHGHALATDARRGVLAIGGVDRRSATPRLLNETWQWNGAKWTRLVDFPVALSSIAVGDGVRGRVLVAYGARDSVTTYAWDGRVWRSANSFLFPPSSISFAYDSFRDRLLAVGPDKTEIGIWWLHENGRYERLVAAASPPGRNSPGVIYHKSLDKILLFGGTRWVGQDTWLWSGKTWEQHKSAVSPPAAVSAGQLTYDSQRGTALCFVHGMLWSFDKAGWRLVRRDSRIPLVGSIAHDPSRAKTVLAGPSTNGSHETWEWGGKQWVQKVPRNRPATYGRQLHFVPSLGGVVMLGGQSRAQKPYGDAWLWDGADWTRLGVQQLDTDRRLSSSVYDSGRQRIVASLDSTARAFALFDRTLDLDQRRPRQGESFAAHIRMPWAAPGGFLLAFSDRTHPGVALRNNSGVGPELLPLGATPLLFASVQTGLIVGLDSNGRGSIPLRIPTGLSLQDRVLHFAGIGIRPSGAFRISNPCLVRIR